HGDRLVDHEQSEIGDVLADLDRQRISRLRHRAHENRPELAIVSQSVVKLTGPALPRLLDGLQPRRRLQQQISLELPRICYFLGCRAVGLGRALHDLSAPARKRSISWLLSRPYTFRPLRYDC